MIVKLADTDEKVYKSSFLLLFFCIRLYLSVLIDVAHYGEADVRVDVGSIDDDLYFSQDEDDEPWSRVGKAH